MDHFDWEYEAFERRDAALAEAARRRLLRLAAQAHQEQIGHDRRSRVATGWALDLKTLATAASARLALLAPSWLRGVARSQTPPEEAFAVPR